MTDVHDFAAATRVERAAELLFHAQIPDGWQQGRGAFGGLVLAVLARALEASVGDATRTLRSISGEIVGPVLPGIATIEIEVVRRGSGVTTLSAKLRQGDEVLARATGVFGKSRGEMRSSVMLDAPSPPPFADVARTSMKGPFGPSFAEHFDMRSTGPLPFSGAREAVCSGWVRAVSPPSVLGMPEIIAYADAWWPATFGVEPAPRPMATISFTLEPCIDPSTLVASEPLYYRARALSEREGFVMELRELWTADGRLVAVNPQTFVVIK